ncbi:hypothetical protein RRG08_013731 [Elysia crispata]|uniref:Uncharacterized protein n=1 Tax=Elysia crispata TaxID=231223 RepID=A0AAE1DJL6_9GAST|nr:hypothetical protein RRG08_013731 [Elysia crispata]
MQYAGPFCKILPNKDSGRSVDLQMPAHQTENTGPDQRRKPDTRTRRRVHTVEVDSANDDRGAQPVYLF